MDLLKYLKPMKNLPDRFSNLAFWRGVRKLKDEVVNAFEYVDEWGTSVERELNLSRGKLTTWSETNIDTIITNDGKTFTFDTNWSAFTYIANSISVGGVYEKPLPITMNLDHGEYAIFLYLDDFKYKIGVSPAYEPYGTSIHTYTLRIIYVHRDGRYETLWSYLTNNGNLISFGDSTTYGQIGGASGQSRYNYPSAIGNALKMSVRNEAVCEQGLIKDWDEINTIINSTDFSPYKLCTIAWSYNDYPLYSNIDLGTINDNTPTTVLGYYRAILDTIQSKNINMRVILITGYGYPDINNGENMMEQPIPFKDGTITAREYYEKLEMMAVRHGYSCINQAAQPWLNLSNISLIGDNIHPTDDGYKVYSNYIVGRICSLFNPIY